jgi:hypothetical protein
MRSGPFVLFSVASGEWLVHITIFFKAFQCIDYKSLKNIEIFSTHGQMMNSCLVGSEDGPFIESWCGFHASF